MFDSLIDALSKQGLVGVVMAALLWLFVRFFNKTFDAQAARDKDLSQFLAKALETMQEIKSACSSCRSEVVTQVSNRLGSVEEKVLAEVRATGDRVVGEARRESELSRPHSVTPPPVPLQPYPPVPGYGGTR